MAIRGGKRPNSGRPKKSYRTVTVAFRVREEWKKIITDTVKAKVGELKKGTGPPNALHHEKQNPD